MPIILKAAGDITIFSQKCASNHMNSILKVSESRWRMVLRVSDPGKGVCADPVDGGAILGRGGPDPHSRDRERQLAWNKGRGKTWPTVKWEDNEWTRKTTPSQLQNASMHRVSWCAQLEDEEWICTNVYNCDNIIVYLLYLLFQENKSFGDRTSDVRSRVGNTSPGYSFQQPSVICSDCS